VRKLNFKSNLISTLPNISNISDLCQNLYKANFVQIKNKFTRTYKQKKGPIKEISQEITVHEDLNLSLFNQNIKTNFAHGTIFHTNLLDSYLSNQPLPLSAQKQELLESIARMNNFKLNEAECIYIEQNSKLKKSDSLEPNLSSQLSSELHFNHKSRLTLGESMIEDGFSHKAYGSALLQVSHLSYHALDLDLSLRVHQENKKIITQKLFNKVKQYQFCFHLPYSLNNNQLSDHGYIVQLKDTKITPDKIAKLFPTKCTAFAGITISTGIAKGEILSLSKNMLGSQSAKQEKTENYLEESIGHFMFDPNYSKLKKGSWNSENIGKIKELNGETIMIIFPILQTFQVIHK
jgi:hypothetical protein